VPWSVVSCRLGFDRFDEELTCFGSAKGEAFGIGGIDDFGLAFVAVV
jgi:hypothetical protein